jgi:hypothetical protein
MQECLGKTEDAILQAEISASSFLSLSWKLIGFGEGDSPCCGSQLVQELHCCQMAGGEKSPAEIETAISNFMSPDKEPHRAAGEKLLEFSEDTPGLNILIKKKFRLRCEDIVDDVSDARRNIVITCLSRIDCRQLAQANDWDERALRTGLGSLSTGRAVVKGNKDSQILKAMRLFVLSEKKVQFDGKPLSPHQIAEKLGWVRMALSCWKDQGPAILLLDALKGVPNLPGAMIDKDASLVAILKHFISRDAEPEKVAAMFVASHVIASLTQGGANVPVSRDCGKWLGKLGKADIVKVLVDCIKVSTQQPPVGAALSTLKALSLYDIFSEDLDREDVMLVLVNKGLKVEVHRTSVSSLLCRVLTFPIVADAFTTRGCLACLQILAGVGVADAVVREMVSVLSVWLDHAPCPRAAYVFTSLRGFTRCLARLGGCGLEDAKPILALLVAWSGKRPSTPHALHMSKLPVNLAVLVRFLTEQDEDTVHAACILVSWALSTDFPGRQKLVEEFVAGAVNSLLLFYVRSPYAAPHALRALEHLMAGMGFNAAINARLAYLLAVHDLLVLLSEYTADGQPEQAVDSLKDVAITLGSTDAIQFLVDNGAVCALVDSLEPDDAAHGPALSNILRLTAVNNFLEVINLGHSADVVPAMVKSLVKVITPHVLFSQ